MGRLSKHMRALKRIRRGAGWPMKVPHSRPALTREDSHPVCLSEALAKGVRDKAAQPTMAVTCGGGYDVFTRPRRIG